VLSDGLGLGVAKASRRDPLIDHTVKTQAVRMHGRRTATPMAVGNRTRARVLDGCSAINIGHANQDQVSTSQALAERAGPSGNSISLHTVKTIKAWQSASATVVGYANRANGLGLAAITSEA
jgi:hypothetical protein